MNKLEELKNKKLELESEILKEAKNTFKKESAFLFKDHPSLKSFSWTQYTPHFNDGDSCIFEANIEYPTINDVDLDDFSEDNDEELDEKLEEAVVKFLSQFDNDMLEDMFGDHCEVIVTKKEVSVESYSHD